MQLVGLLGCKEYGQGLREGQNNTDREHPRPLPPHPSKPDTWGKLRSSGAIPQAGRVGRLRDPSYRGLGARLPLQGQLVQFVLRLVLIQRHL